MTSSNPIRIPRPALESWTTDILLNAGIEQADAALAGQTLVRTDARGFPTHGIARLKSYLAKLANGEISRKAQAKQTVSGSWCRIEAGGVLGHVAGPRAVDAAIELARDMPAVIVQLNDTAHLGALGVHVLRAADAGMVALLFQATPPIMGVPGASGPMIGNNPLAMAAPRPNGPPVVVDMACCVAARGNILLASRTGAPIPEGWALDPEGEPTTDAEAALLGSLLPFGGHKGLGLAMIVEVLAGSLAGATFQESLNPAGGWRSGTGHMNALLLVLNPELMTGRAAYEAHISAWTTHVLKAGGASARIPGERAYQAEREAERIGVPVPGSVIDELMAIGRDTGIPFPFEPSK